MSRIPIKPQNLPESLVWYSIIGTYPIYLLGAQYVCATFLASFLTFYLIRKWWNQSEKTPLTEKITISPSAWVWIIAMLVIEVALIVGHLNFDLEISQILKSSFMWYRNWGLLALFPLIGHINIRSKIIYRAVCIFCFQSLIIVIICSIAEFLKIPIFSYVSPLKAFGGVIDSYKVHLFYVFDENEPRLQLFAPWPPALGFVANIYFCLAQQELNKKWRLLGIVGAVAMVFGSVSRSAMVCLPSVLVLTWILTNFARPWVHILAGFVSTLIGIFSSTLISYLDSFNDQFNQARSGSSEIRARLRRMAQDAWWNEAPIWGHGRMEATGPVYLASKPIGSHHAWFGILYAQGLVGCIALAVAFLWSFIDLLIKAQTNEQAKVGLSILLIMFFFTFAENIDTLTYICWPGLLLLGIAFKKESILQQDKSDSRNYEPC
ncbi:MAG: O-antigen ligase family protein [Nostoc sp.]|uniref:O-antigen ligase family protein n=1 Tax=Nostoc sp. TaxID=1180 RepID=UPI002FF01CDD